MRKQDRQALIRQLIIDQDIERQEDFVNLLNAQNIVVTQATVSRDIKEMQLVKVPSRNGGYHYSLPIQRKLDTEKKLQRTLRDSFVSIAVQDKNAYIKTLPAGGAAIAALVDQMNYDMIFATISDDDSILIICTSAQEAKDFESIINHLLTVK